jgi:predicted ribosome quality control (RQC) complex YloA/Tae2 family protein
MDNFLLQSILTAYEPLLWGGRIGKIYQIGSTDLALDLRLRDGRWLVVSTDPQRLAFYLSSRSPKQRHEELRSDTPFVSLLKKHLGGAKLLRVEKPGYDRIVHLVFETEDEPRLERRLVILLTGSAANVLVVEGVEILAALRERREEGYRDPAPPAEKIDPFQITPAALEDLIAANGGDIAAAARKSLVGFSPQFAEELAARSETDPPEQALAHLLSEIFEVPPNFRIYSSPAIEELKREIGRDEFRLLLSPIDLQSAARIPGLVLNPPPVDQSPEAIVDQYFSLLEDRRRFLASRQKLLSQLSARQKKQRTLAANLNRELAGFAKAETHQRYGELLLANLHQAVKTDAGFEVVDFYDADQRSITISPADKATPREAADHYFKLARKARHGQETIERRLPEIEADIASLERQIAEIKSLTRTDSLDRLLKESQPTAPPPARKAVQTGKKVKEEKLTGVRRYRSSDGFEILVGRNDRDNDHLTFRIAKSFDLWFHAADYPGSHVILRNPHRKPPPPGAVAEAAQLAAKFSQARSNAKVAVNYCERKFVTKPKGFAPGQVRLSSFKTILVEPIEAGERF